MTKQDAERFLNGDRPTAGNTAGLSGMSGLMLYEYSKQVLLTSAMPNDIPVQFDHKGKHYKGYLHPVSGSGGNVWHLMIDDYYKGTLAFYEYKNEWAFHSQTGEFEDMVDYFSEVVIAWKG